jgi:arginase
MKRPVDIHVVPFHAGMAGCEVANGPHRLIAAGLVAALGAPQRAVSVTGIDPGEQADGEIGRSFELMRRVARAVAESRLAGHFPLILAGNCNTSVGVHAGLDEAGLGVVWFDAHPDFSTPDEVTGGYFDGMAVATLAGHCWHRLTRAIPGHRPIDLSRFVYCGIRDFEPGQREKVEAHGIRAVYGGGAVPLPDFAARLDHCLESVPPRALIHLDLDCLDISVGKANRFAAPGGLTADDLMACIAAVVRRTRPAALTVASFDPSCEGSEAIAAVAVRAAVMVAEAA